MKTDKIIQLEKTNGANFFKQIIFNLTEYFGVIWSDIQLDEFSNEFYDNFKYWTIADAKLFSKRVKSLHYGKLFGALSPANLMEWANIYDDEWLEVSAIISQNKHKEFRHEENSRYGLSENLLIKDFLKNTKS